MNIDRVVQHTATIDIRISESLEESYAEQRLHIKTDNLHR